MIYASMAAQLWMLDGLHDFERIQLETVPSSVLLWQLKLALSEPIPTTVWAALNAEEQSRCLRYRQYADQVRFACTRAALRQLLRLPSSQSLSISAQGKPYLLAGHAPFFNVSHAGEYALLAISHDAAVGVDIEQVRTMPAQAELMHSIFTADEQAYCANDAAAFYQIWTAKEALLKAQGCGISDNLASFSVLPLLGPAHPSPSSKSRLWPIPAPAGYIAALALHESGTQ